MKTYKEQIKTLTLSLIIMLSINFYAQESAIVKKAFLRVYNLEGNKIGKGHVVFINDSLLRLKVGSKQENISFQEIGSIKTKRSPGNNVLIGSVSGATLGAIMGISSADPDALFFSYTAGEGAVAFGGIGALGGGVIGGITALFKKSETFAINADEVNWSLFQKAIDEQRFQ
ncbi:hypothetical protein ACGK9U_06955 [Mariniflexile sp. HNIBRBA6329]|uniref:hypothetical protein n=1 Tax=Mariniflexile sp. HNIBRBA6329 TaxID=3373088 RepID=UPI003745D369